MKRYLQLAITIALLTAPVSTLVIIRYGAELTGGYPFFGICSWIYLYLHRSTDTAFVLVVLGMFIFWIAMYAASLLVSRCYPLKFVLCFVALLDLLVALIRPIHSITALWDALFICSTMIVGKKKMPAQSSSPWLARLHISLPSHGHE